MLLPEIGRFVLMSLFLAGLYGYILYQNRFKSKSDSDDDDTKAENIAQLFKPQTKDKNGQKSNVTFNDVLGIDDFKEELQEIVTYLKNPKHFDEMGAQLPRGVLLAGPPGTGKTMLAKAIAGEAGCSFYYMSGSQFEQKYVLVVDGRLAWERGESETCSRKQGRTLQRSYSSMK
jgi:ATP-dependent metalloprotease